GRAKYTTGKMSKAPRHGSWLRANGYGRWGKQSALAISHQPSAMTRIWIGALMAALCVLWSGAALRAHDIPNDVTVQAFVKPDGQTLRLLVRVPLLAMRDMDYPKRPGSTNAELVDLSRADST